MKISYNWLGELVRLTLNPKELAERLTMAGLAVEGIERIRDDHILDFDLTSNRPDALSHFGIAREAALICGTALTPRAVTLAEADEPSEAAASVEILDPDLCPRYAARVVRGVKVGPSPKWLVDRLESIGQRSVNNVADITNYVMFETNQPTHAFDLNLLHGHRIIVRRPHAGEEITTLDGFTRELAPEMLIIADADRAVAIAGVMGGADTEISESTRDVLIESAYFNPASVRHTARVLGMDTEASYRFARGADYDGQVRAADRVAQMIAEIAGGQVLKRAIDVYPTPITRDSVALRESRIERLTGLKVSIDQAADILRALEFEVELDAGEKRLSAVAPSFRVDVSREEDLVEEVARHVGYDLVDVTLPMWGGAGKHPRGDKQRRNLRRTLTALGFDEAYSFSFVNGERDRLFRLNDTPAATLLNPIDVNQSEMRTSLVTGLLDAVQHNLNQGTRDVKLFEIGRVFAVAASNERPVERELFGMVMTGSVFPDDWRGAKQIDFYDLKGAVEAGLSTLNVSGFTINRARVEYLHPGQSAVLARDGEEIARFGSLHPRVASLYKFRQPVFVGEIEFEKLLALPPNQVRYSALPRFPAASRDVSALMPDTVMWGDIETAVRDLGISEIESVRIFDMYKGKEMREGFHSLAFRVIYRAEGRTLKDEEVTEMHQKVTATLRLRFEGLQLR
ncbi:MAG TPA: phenylalanine--tRNA ligase subunit beta [Blastocatellia bacterium]|nr:phenylalanine--tRNA ligase subunit beta [Blastocatellia bacterium]